MLGRLLVLLKRPAGHADCADQDAVRETRISASDGEDVRHPRQRSDYRVPHVVAPVMARRLSGRSCPRLIACDVRGEKLRGSVRPFGGDEVPGAASGDAEIAASPGHGTARPHQRMDLHTPLPR